LNTISSDYKNECWQITIPGDPVAQKRHRHRRVGTRVLTYDPSSTDKKQIEKILGLVFKDKWKFKGAIAISIKAYFKTPTSWSKVKREEAEGLSRPKKPDFDNVAKFYCDAMNGIVYEDDNQIVYATVQKMYSVNPRVIISIQNH